jgi:hypothetical protein
MGVTSSHVESTEDCLKYSSSSKSDHTISTMTDSTLSSRHSNIPNANRNKERQRFTLAQFDKPSAILNRFPPQQRNHRKCKVDPHNDQNSMRPGTPMPESKYRHRVPRCGRHVDVSSKKSEQEKATAMNPNLERSLSHKISIPARPGTSNLTENDVRKIPRKCHGEPPSTPQHSHYVKTMSLSSSQPSFHQMHRSPSMQVKANLQPGSFITIGKSIRKVEEVIEAFDVISANRNDESLPAPWHETERKISLYLSQNDGKATPIECPPRFQERSDFGPVAVTHDVDYMERLYKIRTWNMHKLISDARDREDHSSNSTTYNYTYSYHHDASDYTTEGNDDMIFEMD